MTMRHMGPVFLTTYEWQSWSLDCGFIVQVVYVDLLCPKVGRGVYGAVVTLAGGHGSP